jgi:HEAT repeat protein
MKSSAEQLKNRGYVSNDDLSAYKNLPEKDLMELFHDKEPYKRTAAIKLLAQSNNERHIPLFCEALKTEKKLYTKIALCNALASYNTKAIPYLMPLLGTIGSNQHKKIELADIHKKSYPLPRDIIGRILIRIGPATLSPLRDLLLKDENQKQTHEAIDVIGHITWNYADYSLEKVLIKYYEKHRGNEFAEWKIIRAFQSFKSTEVGNILTEVVKTHKNKVIREEAKRSLDRIGQRS